MTRLAPVADSEHGHLRSPSIAVVHLARAANGLGDLQSFIESYRSHEAGIEHELIVVFKGYDLPLGSEIESILAGIPHSRLYVADRGVDIDAYFGVLGMVTNEVVCFLNSFSVVLRDRWLANLYAALSKPNVGLVGATGSWQSVYMPYMDAQSIAIARAQQPTWRQHVLRLFPILRSLKQLFYRRKFRALFEVFPNYHLRTNAFMIRRDIAAKLEVHQIVNKLDAWAFESGKRGLTSQVLAMGFDVLVVDANGRTYGMKDWYASNTFWRKNQENLMIADNQTRAYEFGTPEVRASYSRHAWGNHADPGRGG